MKSILKKIFLPVLLLFVTGTCVNAQVNTGANPYLKSQHTYTVNGGTAVVGNSYAWSVVGLVANTDYTISGGDTPTAIITWDQNITATTYTLRLVEDDGSCQSIREMTITVVGNDLNAAIADLADACPDPSVNNLVTTNTETGQTIKTFTVTLSTGDATWTPAWKFDYEITNSGSAAISSVVVGGVDQIASLTGDDIAVAANSTSVDIMLTFENILNEAQNIVVSISDVAETEKNTPEALANVGDDNKGLLKITPMPATSDIQTD